MFPRLFSGEHHHRVVEDAVPEDARVTHATLDYTGRPGENDVAFVLESPQWGDVPEGEPIPDIEPVFETLYEDFPGR